MKRILHFSFSGDETDIEQWLGSPVCQKYMSDNDLTADELLHDFFKKYVKLVADKGFHVDGWEEVWQFQNSKTGVTEVYDPSEWNVDLDATTLTAYHWNNVWLDEAKPGTGYMMATGL